MPLGSAAPRRIARTDRPRIPSSQKTQESEACPNQDRDRQEDPGACPGIAHETKRTRDASERHARNDRKWQRTA